MAGRLDLPPDCTDSVNQAYLLLGEVFHPNLAWRHIRNDGGNICEVTGFDKGCLIKFRMVRQQNRAPGLRNHDLFDGALCFV